MSKLFPDPVLSKEVEEHIKQGVEAMAEPILGVIRNLESQLTSERAKAKALYEALRVIMGKVEYQEHMLCAQIVDKDIWDQCKDAIAEFEKE